MSRLSADALAWMWWGPLRRPLEAVARRLIRGERGRILAGPLRGTSFAGGLAHRLGIYEIELQRHLARVVAAGSTVLDVGAHLGFVSLLAARLVGERGLVVAFEPLPANAALLIANIEANAFARGVVRVVQKAVGDHDGPVVFADTAGSSPRAARVSSNRPGLELPMTRLDEIELPLQKAVLKIDVEGAAGPALVGGMRLIERARPPAVIEIHDPEEERAVRTVLGELGYLLTRLPTRADARRAFPFRLVAAPR